MTSSPKNLDELIRGIASRIGATEAVVFGVEQDSFEDRRIDLLLHVRPDNAELAIREAAVAAFKALVSPCIDQARDGAMEVQSTDNVQGRQYCLVTLARRDSKIVGAAAFIVRCRDERSALVALGHVISGS